MFKRLTSVTLIVLLFTACTTKTVSEDTNEPLRIGFIGPLTGGASTYGQDGLHAAQMKVDEINEKGGINGRMIKFIIEDARCQASDAASAAQKLVHIDNVVAIIGGQCSGETLAAAPITEAANIPLISPMSESADVTEAGDFVFRITPNNAVTAKMSAKHALSEGKKRFAFITENTDFATGFREIMIENLPEDAVVFDEIVHVETKDYRTLITRLQDIDFDIFIANGQSVATVAAMIQQLREFGLQQSVITNGGADSPQMIELIGSAAEGMQMILPPTTSANEQEFSQFKNTFVAKFGGAQSAIIWAAFAYDSVEVLAQAIENVGTDGKAIRDYLYNVKDFAGVSGNFSFDKNGDATGIPIVLKEIRNGEIIVVKPVPVE